MTEMIRVERHGEVAVVTLAREPVNTMNMAMWEALLLTLDDLEREKESGTFEGNSQAGGIRGIIFQSGVERDVFTAGNDIMELYAPNTSLERYRKFWVVSNTFLARLYASPLVTIAAIRGACPAGGCCLALCCDYRIMTQKGSIGLNEVALGISVPKYWGMLMARTVGNGPAEKLLQFAKMPSSTRAKEMGLVDEIAPREQLLDRSMEVMQSILKLPDTGRAETKRLLRESFSYEWRNFLDTEAHHAWKLLSHPVTVNKLKAVLEELGKRKDRKNANPSKL